MCLGSLLFPKFVSPKFHPLMVYGVLELAIGAIGLLEIRLVPIAGDLYTHMAQPGQAHGVWLRAIMAGICLLPPTILMGATLPAISRYVETSPRGVSWLGFFYGGNTLGAVVGCLLAGFYLLRIYDMATATYCAAAINAVVSVLAIAISFGAEYEPAKRESEGSLRAMNLGGASVWPVYVTMALSGLTGLGAEVVWTRQLSLMLGATVYTFSNILAVFLLGLGIGSSIGSFVARSSKNAAVALAWCQFLLAGAIAWAAYAISMSLPFWPVDPGQSTHPWYTFQVNLAEVFWAVLPGALLWGASFPLGLAAVARKGEDPGRMVGRMYAANTIGAIFGSLIFSMLVMQYLGSQNAQRILVGLCTLSGLIVVMPAFGRMMAAMKPAGDGRDIVPASAGGAALLAVGVVGAVIASGALILTIDPPNWGAVAWGRNSASQIPRLYPGVLHKEIPLNEAELQTMKEANDMFDFTNLDVVRPDGMGTGAGSSDGWKLSYTLKDASTRPKVEEWLKSHETSLVSGLWKKARAADEYLAVLEANARGMKGLHLENGEIKYSTADGMADDAQAQNAGWLADHKRDLTAALQKRADSAGDGSIRPYGDSDEVTPNRYCVYVGEGMNVSVAVTYDDAGYRYFHGAGKVQASSNPADMRLQRSLGHISALTNYAQTKQTPKDVLVVACGAGVTAGSFVPYGCNITIVDIEPMVPRYVTPQFADVNHDVIPFEYSGRPTGYKGTHIVIDDGRHFIRTTQQKFDVITSDPIDPWVKGCAALNTVEYYTMCKQHLKPGGIMALWIPFYESSEDTSKSVIATFFKVFPNGIIWSNDQAGQGYDAVLFGSVDMQGGDGTLKLNLDEIQEYLDMPEHSKIKRSLQDVGFGSKGIPGTNETVELLGMYAGTAPRMQAWTKGTDNLINRDSNLRLQYVAGMWINRVDEVTIFNNILRNYSYPDEIFS
ncbi:MAG TPA: fused MFS/spermidine synthase, partial [Phycisphaerae bacterium]